MVKLFPSKANELREVFMWMFNEVLGEDDLAEEAFKIINKIICNLSDCFQIFLNDPESEGKEDGSLPPRYF
jgi:hypothetical protein